MNNSAIQIKVKERLNKLSSNDYDNIECWQIVEAFNKAQIEWIRRQIRGGNVYRDGDEQSRRRVDDLQILLFETKLDITKRKLYYESSDILPSNYLEYKRVDVEGKSECCENNIPFVVYLAEEANRSQLLRDEHKKPSFEWGETFSTLMDNKVRIYTNDDFELVNARLVYYRFPVYVQIENCVNPYTGLSSSVNVECEFKDDIVELLIDEAVSILAGDTESGNQFTRGSDTAERNN
jgi:hypothetical protein